MIKKNEVFINVLPHETRVAIVENDVIQELYVEHTRMKGVVGNIYLGKIARIVPGMQSAFIDIGLERAAFLHVSDLLSARDSQETNTLKPIEKLLYDGQILMVQVLKAPIGTKGARLTTNIALPGRTLVYLPQQAGINISHKIDDLTTRETIKDKLSALIAPFNLSGGFIIRTNAEECSDFELANDVHYLQALWQDILAKTQNNGRKSHPEIRLIYEDIALAKRVLRDFTNEFTANIHIDDRTTFDELIEFSDKFSPNSTSRITLHEGQKSLFNLYHIEEEIQSAFSRRVDLKSGGYLVIDQTEALTAIDVNTGRFLGQKNFEETIYKTNLEAAQKIAQQLRLRNIGGIIIIDFIDMSIETHQQSVLETFKSALTHDRAKTYVSDFTALGLVEMTRKRTTPSLMKTCFTDCPNCEGSGLVKSAQTICYEILRELDLESIQFNHQGFKIICSKEVAQLLMEDDYQYFDLLMEKTGKPIEIVTEPYYPVNRYDIILA